MRGETIRSFIDCQLFDLNQQIYDVTFSCLTHPLGRFCCRLRLLMRLKEGKQKLFRVLKWPRKNLFPITIYTLSWAWATINVGVGKKVRLQNFLVLVKCRSFRSSCKCQRYKKALLRGFVPISCCLQQNGNFRYPPDWVSRQWNKQWYFFYDLWQNIFPWTEVNMAKAAFV